MKKIKVDFDLCESNAMCEALAPSHFEIDDDDYLQVLDDGLIAFWTYRRSQKIVNLRRDPRITCLVEDGEEYFELRGVSIQGRARLVEEYDDIHALGSRVAKRMAGGVDLGDFGDEIVDKQARKRVGVVVEPIKVATWDHRKMSGPPGSGG